MDTRDTLHTGLGIWSAGQTQHSHEDTIERVHRMGSCRRSFNSSRDVYTRFEKKIQHHYSSTVSYLIKTTPPWQQVDLHYQSRSHTSSRYFTCISKTMVQFSEIRVLTAILWNETSFPPTVVVPQQSSTKMQFHPALYPSTSVPSTH